MMTASGSNVRKRTFQQSPKRECFFQASLVCPPVVDLLIHCIIHSLDVCRRSPH